MAEVTGIAWTDSTFNPWIGCTKVGPGCDHCYAETLDKRHRWGGAEHWGPGVQRHRTSVGLWHHPIAWNAKPFYQCLSCRHRFAPNRKEGYITCPKCSPMQGAMVGDPTEASAVMHTRRRVFCASLADVFDNEVALRWRQDLMDLVANTPNLTWLFLTKRIGMARRMLSSSSDHRSFFLTSNDEYRPPANLWIGATIVNQEEADRDMPKLLATPAAKRFVSYEPALGPVDWTKYKGVDWIIVGGESTQGAKARPFDITAARDTISQCREIGAAPFVKQLGSTPIWSHRIGNSPAVDTLRFKDRAGADPAEWPEDLRVQEFPA